MLSCWCRDTGRSSCGCTLSLFVDNSTTQHNNGQNLNPALPLCPVCPPFLAPPCAACSYLWADVMSADGFMAFEEAGTGNEAKVRRLGRLFRSTFLESGGSVPPAEVFRRFRGRDPRVAEVIKYNELGASSRHRR